MTTVRPPSPDSFSGRCAIGWASGACIIGVSVAIGAPDSLLIGILIIGVAAWGALVSPATLLVGMLILSPLRTLFETESGIALPIDIGQMLFFSAVFVWGLHQIARRHVWQVGRSPVVIAVLIFTIASGASILSAWSAAAWLREWLKWIEIITLILVCLASARAYTARAVITWISWGVIIAGAANAFIGIYQFFGGSGALHLLVEGRFFRAFGTFGQPNPFGGFMGIASPIALALTAASLQRALRWWRADRAVALRCLMLGMIAGVCSALTLIALILSWSRGAWLSIAVAIGIMAIALPRRWWQGAAVAVGAIAAGAVIWTSGLLPGAIQSRLASAAADLTNLYDVRGVDISPINYATIERLAHWQAAVGMANAHPWSGVGFGNYAIAYGSFNLLNWELALGHAHNYYLNVLAETGMIGFMSYLLMWLILIIVTWQSRRTLDTTKRWLAIGLLGSWAYIAMHSLTDNLYVNNLFLQIGALLGVLAILHESIEPLRYQARGKS